MTDYKPMPGKPFAGTEEETLETIRAVLTEEAAPEAKQRRGGARAFVDRTLSPKGAPRRRATDLPELVDAAACEAKPSVVARAVAGLKERMAPFARFRPTTTHVAMLCLALMVVLQPGWVLFGALTIFVFVVATFLLAGPQRIWALMLRRVERVERKDPARGTRLRAQLDRFAMRWDSVLDLLPDGMADDLYMPDMQHHSKDAIAAHDRAVADRLQRMTQGG